MDLGLHGRAALVTGAARGIGRATALALAGEGVRLALADRDGESLRAVADELPATAAPVLAIVDLAEPGGPAAAVEAALAGLGELDLVVVNAGIGADLPLLAADPEWQASLDINLLQAVRTLRATLPSMRARHDGSVVLVASTFGLEPGPFNAAYNTAKAGLLAFAKSTARTVAADGVRVNCVCPGPIHTPAWDEFAEQELARRGEAVTADGVRAYLQAHGRASVPAGRFGRPEEIAAAIVFLLSRPASFITGSALVVDGGSLHGIH